MCARACVCARVCVCVCVFVCAHVYVCVSARARTFVCVCAPLYVCVQTRDFLRSDFFLFIFYVSTFHQRPTAEPYVINSRHNTSEKGPAVLRTSFESQHSRCAQLEQLTEITCSDHADAVWLCCRCSRNPSVIMYCRGRDTIHHPPPPQKKDKTKQQKPRTTPPPPPFQKKKNQKKERKGQKQLKISCRIPQQQTFNLFYSWSYSATSIFLNRTPPPPPPPPTHPASPPSRPEMNLKHRKERKKKKKKKPNRFPTSLMLTRIPRPLMEPDRLEHMAEQSQNSSENKTVVGGSARRCLNGPNTIEEAACVRASKLESTETYPRAHANKCGV